MKPHAQSARRLAEVRAAHAFTSPFDSPSAAGDVDELLLDDGPFRCAVERYRGAGGTTCVFALCARYRVDGGMRWPFAVLDRVRQGLGVDPEKPLGEWNSTVPLDLPRPSRRFAGTWTATLPKLDGRGERQFHMRVPPGVLVGVELAEEGRAWRVERSTIRSVLHVAATEAGGGGLTIELEGANDRLSGVLVEDLGDGSRLPWRIEFRRQGR